MSMKNNYSIMSLLMIVALSFFCENAIAKEKLKDPNRMNYQINGSFEYATNPDIPDYWSGVGTQFYGYGLPAQLIDEEGIGVFRDKFYLDDSQSFHGKRSLRVKAPFKAIGMAMEVQMHKNYIVSCYLKSDREGIPVTLGIVTHYRSSIEKPYYVETVKAGQEWKRYSIHLKNYPEKNLGLFVVPREEGTIWLDAVQIEQGDIATPFAPSHYDLGFKLPLKAQHPVPGCMDSVPEAVISSCEGKKIELDGRLDEECWRKATRLNMNDIVGAPSSTETNMRVAYDDKNLYCAFKCSDPEGANGLGDHIEIFLDPMGTGEPYYQFLLTANGDKSTYKHRVSGQHELNLKGYDWDGAVQKVKNGWTAEVRIPFSTLNEFENISSLQHIRMNFSRFYTSGEQRLLSWAPTTTGLLAPHRFGKLFLEGKGNKEKNIEISPPVFTLDDPARRLYSIFFEVTNRGDVKLKLDSIISVEEYLYPAQIRTLSKTIKPKETVAFRIGKILLHSERCRLNVLLKNSNGDTISHFKDIVFPPYPMTIYMEYSYYTTEKKASVAVDFSCSESELENKKLQISVKLSGYHKNLYESIVPFKAKTGRQLVEIPLKGLTAGHEYRVEMKLLNQLGDYVMEAETKFPLREPNQTEVKVNQINRGIYVDGKPFIPYGVLTIPLDDKQLDYYKSCGFDYIGIISHWFPVKKVSEFLKRCEKRNIRAVAYHIDRPGKTSPVDAVRIFSKSPALIGLAPSDESTEFDVYRLSDELKAINPYILNCTNYNIFPYEVFEKRLRDFPADVLSIDRYPLLFMPKGKPQTHSEIYTMEGAIEMMDKFSQHNRKPLYFFMQAGERFSREPTPVELTWMNYILLVNHCMGFLYFGGVPCSEYAWEAMQALNREIQFLKPALFSLEEDPTVLPVNKDTKDFIRILAKKKADSITLVCVNRAMKPINALIDLSKMGFRLDKKVEVLFEDRKLILSEDEGVADCFKPLERHVYVLRIRRE